MEQSPINSIPLIPRYFNSLPASTVHLLHNMWKTQREERKEVKGIANKGPGLGAEEENTQDCKASNIQPKKEKRKKKEGAECCKQYLGEAASALDHA